MAKPSKSQQIDALSAEGRELYRKVARQWDIRDEPGLTILLTACQSLDRMREAQAILRREGIVTTDRWGQSKPHSATQIEKEARAHLLQCVKGLELDFDRMDR